MTEKGVNALQELKRKIENAYFERCTEGPKDYPPLALTGFEDRPRYNAFIMKLIDEQIEKEN